jgi:hypothetical protein
MATATEKDADGNVSTATTATEAVTVNPKSPSIGSVTATGGAWNLGGTADAYTTVTVYDNGAAVGTAGASATGAWIFNNGGSATAVANFTATVTDQGKSSVAAAHWIEGTAGNDTFAFVSEAALTALAALYGNGGTDTLSMSAPVTLTDADFAVVHKVQDLQLTGTSTIALGANATSAGLLSVADASATGTVSINASGLANNTNLTLSGAAGMVVTGLIGDISAKGLTGALTVTAAYNAVDHTIAVLAGSGATTITDNYTTDAVTVTASSAGTIVLSGGASFVVVSTTGANAVTGGSGHNTYRYLTTSASTPKAFDTITNFGTAKDHVDFSAISGLNTGIQTVHLNFLSSMPTSIAAHTIDIVTQGGNTTIYANATGSTESISTIHEDMLIKLPGVASGMNTGDFILHL